MENELMRYINRRTDISGGNQRKKTYSHLKISTNSTKAMREFQLRNHKPGQLCFAPACLLTWFLFFFFHFFTINLKLTWNDLVAIVFFSSNHSEIPSSFQEAYPQKFWKADPMFITRKSRERLSRGDYLFSCLHCNSLCNIGRFLNSVYAGNLCIFSEIKPEIGKVSGLNYWSDTILEQLAYLIGTLL